jgi:uncharacterized protein
MPILVKPFLGCNLKCRYCYEADYREESKPKLDYDIDAVLNAIQKNYDSRYFREVTLHGGEPLCMKKEDAEKILAKACELTGRSSLQTNGTLIDADWTGMFKKYKTHVGISLDGDSGLSSFRFDHLTENKLMQTIENLQAEDIGVSIIAVISRSNAENNVKLNLFKQWLLKISRMGISGRVNPCGAGGNKEVELPVERMVEVYRQLTLFCIEHGLKWSPVSDLASKLNGGSAVCAFQGCDIYHTDSALVVLGDGTVTNCLRTSVDGVYLRHEKDDIRSRVLQNTPVSDGGCQGCEFWTCCMGGCPTTAIGNDWRNRTEFCEVWKSILKTLRQARSVCTYKLEGGKSSGHTDAHKDNPHINTYGGNNGKAGSQKGA